MATQVIETPGGIAFAGFYYPEIQSELLNYLRINRDKLGLTDENIFEVHTQLLAAFSLVGHLANTRLDTVATELLLDSAQMLESVKRLLRLVGIELRSAAPAVTEVVLALSEVTTADQVSFVPQLAEFSTETVPPIIYEDLTGSDLNRTDQVGFVYGAEVTEDNDTAGDLTVDMLASDIVQRSSGSWASDVVGQHLFVNGTPINGGGEYRIVERVSNDYVRVVEVPSGNAPAFQSETFAEWKLVEFTANAATTMNVTGPTFTPWSAPANAFALYVGHEHAQWNQIDLVVTTSPGAGFTGVWEYYDGQRSAFAPVTVAESVGTLVFNVNSLLGTADRSRSLIKVTFLETGAAEYVTSGFVSGVNQITTSDLLGQVVASTDPTAYSVTADWVPFDNQSDDTVSGSDAWAASGAASYDLPQTLDRSWNPTDVNLQTANWARWRCITTTGTGAVLDRARIDQGDQFMVRTVTQGQTIGPVIIGSSTAQTSQEFKLAETPYIDDTETVEVDEGGAGTFVEYAHVESLLGSGSTSRHYVREVDANDAATIRFGDGVNGKIPPAGLDNIRVTYRVGGEVDGNVGAETIVVNEDGVPGVSEVRNPRAALEWRIKDGGDEADLARVKRDSPAELRTRGTATNADDVSRLAVNDFVDGFGGKPVARAFAEEEKFGVKTVGLIVVGAGGGTLAVQQLSELETYFNGDRFARPPSSGVLLMNHEVTALNFEPAQITIDMTVVWPGGNASSIRNKLLAYLTPLAVEEDGTTYVWDFGASVSASKVLQLIHDVDPNIRDVPLLSMNGGVSGASVNLTANQLPVTRAASIAVSILGS